MDCEKNKKQLGWLEADWSGKAEKLSQYFYRSSERTDVQEKTDIGTAVSGAPHVGEARGLCQYNANQ